jgi:hypothetical protein
MDDFKVLLYVIFGVIWLISRVMKSRKKQQAQREQSEDSYEEPQKEVSFEDLLKEFTQGGQSEETVSEYEEPVKYEEPVIEESTWAGSDEEVTSIYEKSIRAAEAQDMADQGHNHHLQRFDVFEEEEEDTFLADLSAELKEDDGLKKAIIYKEILDRKHF